MATKGNIQRSFYCNINYFIFLLLSLLPAILFSQPDLNDIPTQRLRLQLAACYLNVAKENQIDIDSGLALACERSHLSPMIVMSENYDAVLSNPANSSLYHEGVVAVKKLAAISKGNERTALINLI